MEGVPDLSALLKGKLQMLSTKSSSAGASEVRPAPTDGDVNSEPPAQSSPKKKANKAKKRSVPSEEVPSSADISEVAAKKKKKKESKKRSREEASVEVLETSTAAGNDDTERNDPTNSTRGSPEERPKKKLKRKTAEDDGTSAPGIPSRSGEPATEAGDGSRDESPLSKGAPSSSARETDKLKSDRLAKKDALREKTRLERLVASLEKEKAELEGERDAVVGTLVKERQRLRDSRVQEVTRERIKVQTAMADKSTRCVDTGDVATEDPVLVSSSEEREEDEVGEEENRSPPALIEETVPIPSVSDPPAQVEDLGARAVEEETVEPLDPSRDDQDIVV
ncbi:hypothetical protein HID58_021051 [Brassica napus]|uniref:Uncharacterized protein n=1 Tax=Brassica napus TaxID=3708 RepID=A0ABQ8CVI3_BRANA|nr:hypothetical protein HID58_021051 [Brassica napus]